MKSNIRVVDGDITTCPEGINVIMHQANTHNVMGAGVALAITRKWPEAYEVDRRMYQKEVQACGGPQYETVAQNNLLGRFSITQWLDNFQGDKVRILNLYGQRLGIKSMAGCATDYNAVIVGMQRAAFLLGLIREKEGCDINLGIPYLMGCGLAGGNWTIYGSIIRAVFSGLPINVVVVKFSDDSSSGHKS